jgi:sugar lactone lactonase YvrE
MKLKRNAWTCAACLALVPVMTGCGSGNGASPAVLTLAGSSEIGNVNGAGGTARFHNPVNVAVDAQSNVYVCDFDNSLIRKITQNGIVSTLTQQANFDRPFGIAFASDGQLYVQTDGNDTGQRDGTTGTIWRINLTTGAATVVVNNVGRPRGLAGLPDGRLVLSDIVHHTINLLQPSTGAVTLLAGTADSAGFTNATGAAARFNRPYGVTVTSAGNILVADTFNNSIRQVTLAGEVTTFAGTGTAGALDGPKAAATFNGPQDVKAAPGGIVYVDDTSNHCVRKINAAGQVSAVAGNGTAGFRDGALLQAEFFGMEGFAVSRDGSAIYVADGSGGEDDQLFNRVRVIIHP